MSLFHETVADLLAKLGIDNRLADRKPEVYVVAMKNGLELRMFDAGDDSLNLLCFPGKISRKTSRDALLALLQGNLFTYEHPPISISVDIAKSAVVLWSRLRLTEAHAAEALLRRFVDTSDAVKEWLEDGSPAFPAFQPPPSQRQKSKSTVDMLQKKHKE